ncbi:MAG: shikimate kinase [Anaerolineae bacterium]|nr:shikimate kinase [Anaerolineae bacterium]
MSEISTAERPANIILCGFMGTGKTTIGQIIAKRLGWPFVDTDQVIEERQGKAIRMIFAEEGEPFFRRLESDLCMELATWRQTVIATGGGIVVNPDNRAALQRAGLVVCLDAPAEEIAARLAGVTDRPMLAGGDPAARIRELLTARTSAYGTIPCHVDTAGRSPEAITEAIIQLWQRSG